MRRKSLPDKAGLDLVGHHPEALLKLDEADRVRLSRQLLAHRRDGFVFGVLLLTPERQCSVACRRERAFACPVTQPARSPIPAPSA